MAEKQKIGTIFKYFAHPMVAAIKLTDGALSVGDTISIEGHTTNFQQQIESIQIEHESVEKAEVGQSIGIKVKDRVRPHDVVYKVIE